MFNMYVEGICDRCPVRPTKESSNSVVAFPPGPYWLVTTEQELFFS
jgi:hypothetical protein